MNWAEAEYLLPARYIAHIHGLVHTSHFLIVMASRECQSTKRNTKQQSVFYAFNSAVIGQDQESLLLTMVVGWNSTSPVCLARLIALWNTKRQTEFAVSWFHSIVLRELLIHSMYLRRTRMSVDPMFLTVVIAASQLMWNTITRKIHESRQNWKSRHVRIMRQRYRYVLMLPTTRRIRGMKVVIVGKLEV